VIADDDLERLRAEREKIERNAMLDQPGWKERLDRAPDHVREEALRILLPQPTFERWRIIREALSSNSPDQ
jgi:hypothetical protein